MKKSNYYLIYLLMVAVQIVLCNYFSLTPYLSLSILPVMVLTLPIRLHRIWAMGIAFLTGLAVDLVSEGLLGLNALALVPVAFARDSFLSLVFGEELFSRQEDFSVRKNGIGKVTMVLILAQGLFLGIYIWADGAGMRPFWFNLCRFVLSLGAGVALSLLVINPLAPDSRK